MPVCVSEIPRRYGKVVCSMNVKRVQKTRSVRIGFLLVYLEIRY
ncbi:hypothetical protein C7459_1462 [Tumebacillus permanentifrigoris]|uniref:Uncharacterized protein n=1 Tax=Tumebacillus permanentifrigoris TaxID=378543 RepID=A0A316D206_9BACL|nr:hypothetical protein C7459_1462 [Tumebacillus permanentifrigoris]